MELQTIERLAEQLLTAEATCTPIEVPSADYPEMTVEDGYQIQREIVARKRAKWRVGNELWVKKLG